MWEFVETGAPVPDGVYRQTWTFQGPEGYEERAVDVAGPLFHGSRSRGLVPGVLLVPGRRTNAWGDEGERSQFVHFTDRLDVARLYAEQTGGSVYEVEPVGDFVLGYDGSEFKSKEALRIVRSVE